MSDEFDEAAYFRDSGSTAYDRWAANVGPYPDAEPDAASLRWHQKHVDHEPLCHLCREIARLREAHRLVWTFEDDTQAEYVRPEAAD